MNNKEKKFVKEVWTYWGEQGRHVLPWRKTTQPYRIVVSELMLQQTQVDRVLPKYRLFIKHFPTTQTLARASLSEVLTLWQGLGYNRRARLLHDCAKVVTRDLKGKFPDTYDELKRLPGVGPYTAGAVLAFAFNKPVPIIETNIRTVYLHHFFHDQTDVEDEEILKLVDKTLDSERVREWYWALMDYGSYLKRKHGNLNIKSKSYIKQSKFEGSNRQIRGAIVRLLTIQKYQSKQLHNKLVQFDILRIDAQMQKLLNEGMVIMKGGYYSLPD